MRDTVIPYGTAVKETTCGVCSVFGSLCLLAGGGEDFKCWRFQTECEEWMISKLEFWAHGPPRGKRVLETCKRGN